jgi:hypothetical protein
MEKYINIIENKKDKNNVLRVRVYYDKGGMNYGTGREKARGYYISVSPLDRTIKSGYISETYSAFSGFYELLEPCARKSKKAEAAALEKAPAYEKIIVDHILKNTGYILEV